MTVHGAATLPAPGENGDAYFEDFAVGQRFEGPARAVTDRGPGALAGFAHADLGLPGSATIVASRWRRLAAGDPVRALTTVTRCARRPGGDGGVVNRHVALVDADGRRVQEGTVAVLHPARGAGEDDPVRAFGTLAWGRALADRLAGDPRFASATADWDGTLGLRAGDAEVQLRIYRGRVVEATRRVPHGPTFTLAADELTWTELVTGPRNDFMQRAMQGQFDVYGSGYEYLRLTKGIALLVDAARALAAEAPA